jgi:4-amino-4-deoxy-L-arabinose transferase-like glycosyltransferase
MTTSAVDVTVVRHEGDRGRTRGKDVRRRLVPRLVLGACVALFAGLGLYEAWADGPTFDEPVYVSAGLQAVLHRDLTMNEEHPPLPKVLAVLPVLLVGPVVPHDSTPHSNDERSYSARFVEAQQRGGTLRAVTFTSRLAVLLESIAVASLLFLLGRQLFGEAAGTVAASLWLLSPLVLGLSHLDAVDPAFALAVVGWSWVMLRWTLRPTLPRAATVGLVSAAAILSDVTGLLIAGLGLVVMLAYGRSRLPRWGLQQVLVAGALAWAATWAFYVLLDPRVVLDPTVVLPSPYLQGIRYLAANDTQPGPGYLLGVAWTGGRWWYWPGALLVKTVPTTLLVFVVGPIGWRTVDRATRRRLLAVVVAPALLLTAFNLTAPRDIGLRYLLPAIALWLVAASSIVRCGRPGFTVGIAAVAVAGVFTIGSAPDSLAWAAPPFAPAYRSVTNSDVDWGQGFYQLQGWSKGKHPWLAYFGPRGIGSAAVPGSRPLVGTPPDRLSGWVAVSATNLTSAERVSLGWLQAYCPVGELAGSILLYRFRAPPVASTGASRPAAMCPANDRWSERSKT